MTMGVIREPLQIVSNLIATESITKLDICSAGPLICGEKKKKLGSRYQVLVALFPLHFFPPNLYEKVTYP